MIHTDLGIPPVQDIIHARSIEHCTKLESHPNPLYEITSYDDCTDDGQLTCNEVNEIPSLEGTSSR
jgi:hypothetical protein